MKKYLASPILSLLLLALVVSSCERQIARTRQPLKPPEEETELRALPANSSPEAQTCYRRRRRSSRKNDRLRSFLSEH
jgi:hypothetical protein